MAPVSRLPGLAFAAALLLAPASASAQLISRGPWSGALTPVSAEVNLILFESRLTSLEVDTDRDFTPPFITVPEEARRAGDIPLLTRYIVRNLAPDTEYFYRVRAGPLRERERIGRLRTAPATGAAASFRFAVAGGTATGSEAGAIAEIRYHKPRFFLQLGNIHNAHIAANDPAAFADAFIGALDSFARAELLQFVPMLYTWDRHDYGLPPNRLATNVSAAHSAYRQLALHYPFPADDAPALAEIPRDQRPINQAFSIGRVRFLLLDTRTARDPVSTPDNAFKSMLGGWQWDWLTRELLLAQRDHGLVFIVSAVPWFADATTLDDGWSHYAFERTKLFTWLNDNDVNNVCLLSANAGVLAASLGSTRPFVPAELQAGTIDLPGQSSVTGPWDAGTVTPEPTEEFFALIEIDDQRTAIAVNFRGMNQHGQEKLTTRLVFPSRPPQ